MDDLIMVTNLEKVPLDDFYLSKDWEKNVEKETMKEARKLAKDGYLFYAYSVTAKSYALYCQMDAYQHLINRDYDVLIDCETAIIGNDHYKKWEYEI